MRNFNRTILSCAVAATALAGANTSANADLRLDQTVEHSLNGSFVSIKGTAVDPGPDGFVLDYGQGSILVETDDWDEFKEGKLVLDGDEVTVYGLVDNDLYQSKTIEAGGIYIEDLQSGYTNMSATDEEDFRVYYHTGPTAYDFEVVGAVTSTDGREFTIDTGVREVTVDTIAMAYNPMDDRGFQKIETGDIVRVSGGLDIDLFESREILAESIISLNS